MLFANAEEDVQSFNKLDCSVTLFFLSFAALTKLVNVKYDQVGANQTSYSFSRADTHAFAIGLS